MFCLAGFRVCNLRFVCDLLISSLEFEFSLPRSLSLFFFVWVDLFVLFCLADRDCVIKRARKRIVDWEA